MRWVSKGKGEEEVECYGYKKGYEEIHSLGEYCETGEVFVHGSLVVIVFEEHNEQGVGVVYGVKYKQLCEQKQARKSLFKQGFYARQ